MKMARMSPRAAAIWAQIRQRLARRANYRAVFLDEAGQLTDAGEAVLADLARFACVRTSIARRSPVTGVVDTHASMLTEGRREVFNRLIHYLNVSEDQIYSLMEREHGITQ